MDSKFLQTLALVAWVQQQVETVATAAVIYEQFLDYNSQARSYGWSPADTVTEYRIAWIRVETESRLWKILNAAVAGDEREYLRLVRGCPHAFKNRVFIDNAPADWKPRSGSRPSNQSHHFPTVSSK